MLKKVFFAIGVAATVMTFFSGCSETVPMNVKIGTIGEVDDAISVKAVTGDGKIHLSWELPQGAMGVCIRRSENGFPFSAVSGEEIFSGEGTSFIDEDVAEKKKYYYLVIAVDDKYNYAFGVRKSSSVFNYGIMSYVVKESITFNDSAADTDYIYSAGRYNYKGIITKQSKATGLPVPGFGNNGTVTVDVSSESNISSIILDGEYVYAAGYDKVPGYYRWRIEKRSKATGELITEFGEGGVVARKVIFNNTESRCIVKRIVIDGEYIYAAGDQYYSSPDAFWRIEKLDKTTGELVSGFGTGGVLELGYELPKRNFNYLYDIIIDGDSIYAAGVYEVGQDSTIHEDWRIEKRSKVNGALVTGFGTAGVVEISDDIYDYSLQSITADGDFIYAAGYYQKSANNYEWRIEKRNKADGVLVTGFGTGGAVLSDPTEFRDELYSIAVDGDYIYALGRDNNNTPRIEKRSKSDGTLISGFANEGVMSYSLYSQMTSLERLILSEGFIYASGSGADFDYRAGVVLVIDPLTGSLSSGNLVEME
jgi:hypothetical protein